MIENKLKYSENHFFATNLDYVLNTNSNKILAGKWCSKDFIKEGADKSEYVPHVWENIIERENDYIFIKKIMEKYCEKLSAYLNSYNQVNYPVNFWKILILPWLTYYLPSQLYRWKIIQETINIKKNFSFFLYSESKIKKKVFDTVNYYQLIKDDEEFNYNQFSRIIKFLKKKGHKIILIDKTYKKFFSNKSNVDSFAKKIKIACLNFLDCITLFFSKNNKIYIEHDVFGKRNFLKISLHLKQFPSYFIKLFNYHLENYEYNNLEINIEKRKSISFSDDIKVEENIDFIEFLNSSIRKDIPICYLEGFFKLKNKAEKIKMQPKVILSSYNYMHSEKFKLWVALNVTNNGSKFIIATHGGGHHRKFDTHFNFENKIADKRITWITALNKKEIQLPAAKLINYKTKRKYKYLSYVEKESGLFPAKFTDNPFNPIHNEENLKIINSIINKKILKKFIYLPQRTKWSSIKKINSFINKNNIAKPLSFFKYLYKSKIVICSYPETTFNEAILTGPTILVCKLEDYPIQKEFKKIFEDLKKYKIFFSDPEEACEHINKIWDNVDDWWLSTEVKNTVKNFISSTSPTSNNAINLWGNFLKKEAS